MHARTLLFKQLQQFFEQYLAGQWRISDVMFDQPELAPKEPGQRQRHREIVSGMFGGYTISIESTVEEPPLGRIIAADRLGNTASGPIDEVTWRQIAEMIKQPAQGTERTLHHVNGH